MADYAFDLDFGVFRGDDFSFTMTWETTAGVAVDISAWAFAYEANEKASGGTGNIVVADAAMTKSDSGSGTTDSISIPLTSTNTDISEGRYGQDVTVTVGSDRTTVASGTLTIKNSEQD